MSSPILKHITEVNHRVTRKWSLIHQIIKGLLHCSYILWWDARARHIIYEFVAGLLIIGDLDGLYIADHTSVLTSSTRLLLVQVVEICLAADGFTVVDAWCTDLNVQAEFTTHTLRVDLQVELSHSADDDLLRLLIDTHAEGGILALELGECFLEFGS